MTVIEAGAILMYLVHMAAVIPDTLNLRNPFETSNVTQDEGGADGVAVGNE